MPTRFYLSGKEANDFACLILLFLSVLAPKRTEQLVDVLGCHYAQSSGLNICRQGFGMLRQIDLPAPEVVSIGEFCLLPSQRLLTKNGHAIKIGSRSFDILLALADRPGEVVSQKELIARVWPGVFVEDVSLRVHIAALRKALDCDGTRYLANVPGRGYSLVAPTSRATIEETPETDSAIESTYSLPPPLARMVGRDEDVRTIRKKLLAERFVTILGPGALERRRRRFLSLMRSWANLSAWYALWNSVLSVLRSSWPRQSRPRFAFRSKRKIRYQSSQRIFGASASCSFWTAAST